MSKILLGDNAYVELDDHGITLTQGDNEIRLATLVLEALLTCLDDCKFDPR